MLVVLIGPAGAGKSTWAARNFAPNQIVSTDALRSVVGLSETDMAASSSAFELLFHILEARLSRRLATVVDSTALDAVLRTRLRDVARRYNVACRAVLFDTPAQQCRAQNAGRAKTIPATVLTAQLKQYKTVSAQIESEGFDLVDHECAPPMVEQVSTPPVPPSAATSATSLAPAPRKTDVRFGLHLSSFPWPSNQMASRLTELAQAAEASGFDSIWAMDHFRQIPQVGREWDDMPEVFAVLSLIAAATSRVTVGPLVAAVTHRNIALLGKQLATLDVLSGGRVVAGLGLGWHKAEHQAYGIEFPSTNERYELLEDALEFLPILWGSGAKSFAGRRFIAASAMCYPRPLQKRLPILVGGSGEQRTLRLVGQYSDAGNLFGEPPVVKRKVEVLTDHARSFGRDINAISVTHLSTVILGQTPAAAAERVAQLNIPARRISGHHPGSIDNHVQRVRELVAAGVNEVIVSMPSIDADDIELYGNVIYRVRA